MSFYKFWARYACFAVCSYALLVSTIAAQDVNLTAKNEANSISNEKGEAKSLVVSVLPNYYNQTDGISLAEIVRRALKRTAR